MKLKIISDNRAAWGFRKEHGFSVLLQTPEGDYLFDTGRDAAFLENAGLLHVDLSRLNGIILSHGHNDHGGNLKEVLAKNLFTPLYLHPDALQERYSLHPGDNPHTVGLDVEDKRAVEELTKERIRWVRSWREITPEIRAFSEIPQLRKNSGDFYLDREGIQPDPLRDDLSLLVKGDLGYILICGCCHSGLKNTVKQAEKILQENQLHSIIGGLHLLRSSEGEIEKLGGWLKKKRIERVVLCHCSGEQTFRIWKEILKEKVLQGEAGMTLPC